MWIFNLHEGFLLALRPAVIHVPPRYKLGCVALLVKTEFNSRLNPNDTVILEFGQRKNEEMEE